MLVVPNEDDLLANLYDVQDQTIEKTFTFDSNIFKEAVPSYQNGAFVIATKTEDEQLELHQIDANGTMKNILSQEIILDSYLKTNSYQNRGRLIISAENKADTYYIQVQNGKATAINLADDKRLSARPTSISLIYGNNGNLLPYWLVNLKDDSTVQLSGLLNNQNTYSIAQGNSDVAIQKPFLADTGLSKNQLLEVDTSYPKEIYHINPTDFRAGQKLITPKPLYQSLIIPLNSKESLLIGSSTEDETQGGITAYLFNELNSGLTDVSALFEKANYEDLADRNALFYKDENTKELYYDGAGKTTGMFNLETGKAQIIAAADVSAWDQKMTGKLGSFLGFLKEYPALAINWIVWLFIPLMLILLGVSGTIIRKSANKRNKKDSVVLPATIVSANETGVYINNQPRVRFLLSFIYEGKKKEVEVHRVVSVLTQIPIGQQVMIRYNPKKNKAMFVDEADVATETAAQEERISNAKLTAVRSYGAANRGTAVELEFQANSKVYHVPAVEPDGFRFEIGKTAELMEIGGISRILAYNTAYNDTDSVALDGTVTAVKPLSATISGRKLTLLDLTIQADGTSFPTQSSQFVPNTMTLQIGMALPIKFTLEDFSLRKRLSQAKEGSAVISSVNYLGYTRSERPVARVELDINGRRYISVGTIEPTASPRSGDSVWVQYDETRGDAIIVRYS
ncbi:hypothetical protein [Listeria sp. ILCC797]|uniref:hypothetical protein n=1 Tax=Listeria sp. ILCC797 TaxID=1918333 RepID=UPI000B58D42A|nr:hypothetical protein [Listeria sp. ILCC797]